MDMRNYRPELHIAQQSRRDKLRIQQDTSPSHHHLGVYASNLEQTPPHHDALSYESPVCRAGNICYDPSELCSEMINFSQEPHKRAGEESSSFQKLTSRDHHNPTSFNPGSVSVSSDPQYFGTWKSIGSSDWVPHTNSISALDVKPAYLGYQELNNSSAEMNNKFSSLYQNALQELVTSSNVRSYGLEFASLRQKNDQTGHGPWAVGGSELLLLPAYADHMRLKTHSDLITRPHDGCSTQWRGDELDRNNNSNTQALSLSLSSVPSPKVHETQIAHKDFQSTDVCGGTNDQDSRSWKPEFLSSSSNQNLSTASRNILGTQQALTHRNPGPLGPFTGYATILRSSKFLRPAQQLLEELCWIARPKDIEICDINDKSAEDARVYSEVDVSNAERAMDTLGNSGVSSLAFDGSIDKTGTASCSSDVYRPENLQKKAKLMYMQDEVCKRYKQYHQQMQMVVSSFESVAGLSAATPYVSLALKMISKHFRSLKSAITDQIKSIKNALGEELSSPSAGTGEANVSMLKFFDQNFQKQKGAGNNLGILEGQHIWRPQRGLPERAVSILRAWLFDHFLHPYPTDTDKHMLATQTGLTRNQVSNWFINARVRVWKPMVEEIHMLETKGGGMQGDAAPENGVKTSNGKTAVEGRDQSDGSSSSQSMNRRRICEKQVECSSEERSNASIWNHEKRSRIEYRSIDGSLMGFVPSHQSGGGIEMGGMGSVSLTLGLRQGAENAQRPPMQQQQQQQERHLRSHFGGQIIRDFVG